MTEREEIKYACDVADEAELSKLASGSSIDDAITSPEQGVLQ